MSEFISVFITAPTPEEAERIALRIVEENLVACANIFLGIQSVYRWKGDIEQAEECALIAKTTADKFDALQKRVTELHSYDCPCIVSWPITAGSQAFLEWLDKR